MGWPTFDRHKVMAATILTGNSMCTVLSIFGFNKYAFEIPTFAIGLNTDNACVRAVVSYDGTTFRQLRANGRYSAGSGILTWEVPSSTGNYTVVCEPIAGFKYMKLELAGTNASATAAALMCNVHMFQ